MDHAPLPSHITYPCYSQLQTFIHVLTRVPTPTCSVTYAEVKATSTGDKSYFEISHREWIFAQQEGDRYEIYRVTGVGSQQPRVKRIVNPYLQWRSQRVGICLAL